MIEVVDTNVVIYAVANSKETATQRRRARELLFKMSVVNIAAVSAFELEWAQQADEDLGEVVRSWNVLAFDMTAKDHAVRIARRAIALGQMCRKCWNYLPHPSSACSECSSPGSRQRKMNDIFIAGTVIANRATAFYTFNDADFRRHLADTDVQVIAPPDSTLQMTLFEQGDDAELG